MDSEYEDPTGYHEPSTNSGTSTPGESRHVINNDEYDKANYATIEYTLNNFIKLIREKRAEGFDFDEVTRRWSGYYVNRIQKDVWCFAYAGNWDVDSEVTLDEILDACLCFMRDISSFAQFCRSSTLLEQVNLVTNSFGGFITQYETNDEGRGNFWSSNGYVTSGLYVDPRFTSACQGEGSGEPSRMPKPVYEGEQR